jgi:hypothetical protein
MTITSKDLGGGNALTGVARKEHEERLKNQQLLESAIQKVISEMEVEEELDLKKKKEPKKKKST